MNTFTAQTLVGYSLTQKFKTHDKLEIYKLTHYLEFFKGERHDP